MIIRVALSALSFSLLFGIAAGTQAASREDVAEVTAMVNDPTVPGLLRRREVGKGNLAGTTFVFVHDGQRYTLYASPESVTVREQLPPILKVWVVPDGQFASHLVDTFTDYGQDGTIDLAIDGPRRRSFESGVHRIFGKPVGLEHAAFLQQKYDAAIAAALAHKRRVSQTAQR